MLGYFQREMDITFQGLIGKSIVVYLDDVTIFSKIEEIMSITLDIFLIDVGDMVFLSILRSIFLQ
jgi:hypothetical protein